MGQKIQAPNGEIVEFPDGMTDAQISAVMAKHYGKPKKQGFFKFNEKLTANNATPLDAIIHSTYRGIGGNILDDASNKFQSYAMPFTTKDVIQYGNRDNKYNAKLNEMRQLDEGIRKRYPNKSAAGNITGSVLGYISGEKLALMAAGKYAPKAYAAVKTVTKGKPILTAVASNAVGGAAQGAMQADPTNRAGGAVQGAVIGGTLGGLGTAAAKGSGKIIKSIRLNNAAKSNPQLKTIALIEKKSGQKIGNLVNKASALNSKGVPNPTFADASYKLAKNVGSFARADAGGSARELAANRASDMLNQIPSATNKLIRSKTGVQKTTQQIEQGLNQAKLRKQNALIEPIKNKTYPLSPIQQMVMASPNVRNATGQTANILETIAATEGNKSPDAVTLRNILNGRPNDNNVTLGSLEQLRRRLGDQVNNAYQTGNKSLGYDLGNVQDTFMQPIREAFPSYDQALNIGNLAKSQIGAMEQGAQDILNAQTPDIANTLANMTNREQRGFRQGAANSMSQKVMDDRTNYDILRRMAAGIDYTDKLRTIYGNEAAQGMQEGAQALNQRRSAANAVNPNFGSQTQENAINDAASGVKMMLNPSIQSKVDAAIDFAARRLQNVSEAERQNFIDISTRPMSNEQLQVLITNYQDLVNRGITPPPQLEFILRNQNALISPYAGQTARDNY